MAMVDRVNLRGVCRVLFAFDLAAGIDLELAARLIADPTRRPGIRHSRRAPASIGFSQPPLRITLRGEPMVVAGHAVDPAVEGVFFHFGAVLISFGIPIDGPLAGLPPLADALYDNREMLARARAVVESLARSAAESLWRPNLSPLVEDYVVYDVRADEGQDLAALLQDPAVAATLRAEMGGLSEQERADARGVALSYRPDDAALIDWNAAFLVGRENDDILAVLEYANVELLEMRFLDQRLDEALDLWHRRGTRASVWRSARADLARLGRLQADAALLFEGVNNALKLIGDPYLARVYRAAARRLHLEEWDASILRKLGTLERMHGQLSAFRSDLRMEVLEWIIITLIAVEIVVPALRWLVGV